MLTWQSERRSHSTLARNDKSYISTGEMGAVDQGEARVIFERNHLTGREREITVLFYLFMANSENNFKTTTTTTTTTKTIEELTCL